MLAPQQGSSTVLHLEWALVGKSSPLNSWMAGPQLEKVIQITNLPFARSKAIATMALEEFIFDNNNVNLISSLLQIVGLGELFKRWLSKDVTDTKLDKRLVTLNNSGKSQGVGLTLGKRLYKFFLKRRRLLCACKNSALYMFESVL